MNNFKSLSKPICLLIAICGVSLLTLNSYNVSVIKKNISKPIIDTSKFTIITPSGWERHIQASNGFDILFIMAPAVDNFRPNINILTESLNGVSNDEYFKISRENMNNANMILDGSGDFEADGIQGKYSTSSFTYQGRNIATKSFVFIKDGMAYVLTGSCLITQKDIYRPIFDTAIKTFRLK